MTKNPKISYAEIWAECDPEKGFLYEISISWMFIKQNGKLKSGRYYLIPKRAADKLLRAIQKTKSRKGKR